MDIDTKVLQAKSATHKRKLPANTKKREPKRRKLDSVIIEQCSKLVYIENQTQPKALELTAFVKPQSPDCDKQEVAPKTSNSNVEIPIEPSLIIGQDQPMASALNTAQCSNTVAQIEFKIGEIVWAKIKGYAHWPAKIKSFPSSRMAEVIWFNDYRRTKVYKTQLFKFLINFDDFAKKFDDTIGLKTAAQEALICFGNNLNANMLF